MRSRVTLPLILAGLAACAPNPGARAALMPAPQVVAPVDGPEGESPMPSGGPSSAAPTLAGRPALATAVMVPSARIAAAIEKLRDKELTIPVAGVEASRIEDSFTAARDGGERVHNAVDILAPRNTPILAADDGVILRMSSNALGGITIYAADREQQFVYYYAHLDHYKAGIKPGQTVQKGDTIGFVGTTGNAPKDVPHLHFQIMLWPTDGKWWNGEPVNPYPVLHTGLASALRRYRFD
jgi:murein DD-endopeptidase MepM/ murein hydrolase activator NlpD